MSEIRFDGRVVLVSGAGRGLGAAYANALAAVEQTRAGLASYGVGKMAHFALMIVTAREGEPYGVLANAVAPVAGTRMLARAVEPGELEPEQVAPSVLLLASERCSVSGRVLEAGGGDFSIARWTSSDEVSLGREPVEPETLAERWDEIEGAVRT